VPQAQQKFAAREGKHPQQDQTGRSGEHFSARSRLQHRWAALFWNPNFGSDRRTANEAGGFMPHDVALIATLAIGFALAFVFGFAANRAGLPPLVGYLVAGVLVGPFTPGFVGDRASTGQLAEVGVMLLMFGVGLHFSVDNLVPEGLNLVLAGALVSITLNPLVFAGADRMIRWVRSKPNLNSRFEESRSARFARLEEDLKNARRRQAEKAAASKTFTPEELVDRFPLFAGLTPEQREVLVLHFGCALWSERIIRAGDKADAAISCARARSRFPWLTRASNWAQAISSERWL
jgi:Sodium/hydrogen exchanger family